LEIDILESLNFVSPSKVGIVGLSPVALGTFRNVILRSPSAMLRINSATKNLLVICFEGVKNIKQILHCVQDDSQCQTTSIFHSL
jgi:hypothetical protein